MLPVRNAPRTTKQKNGPVTVTGPYCFCESQERRNLTLVKKEEKKKRFLLRLLFYDGMRTLAVRRDYADTTQNLRLYHNSQMG
jgi:hypothetical protein